MFLKLNIISNITVFTECNDVRSLWKKFLNALVHEY